MISFSTAANKVSSICPPERNKHNFSIKNLDLNPLLLAKNEMNYKEVRKL